MCIYTYTVCIYDQSTVSSECTSLLFTCCHFTIALFILLSPLLSYIFLSSRTLPVSQYVHTQLDAFEDIFYSQFWSSVHTKLSFLSSKIKRSFFGNNLLKTQTSGTLVDEENRAFGKQKLAQQLSITFYLLHLSLVWMC